MTRLRRLVLRSATERDAAAEYADAHGWERVSDRAADPDQGVPEEVMWRSRDGIYFYYTVEPASGAACIGLIGVGVDPPQDLQDGLEAHFAAWTPSELLAAVDQSADPRDYAAAVVRASLGAPVGFADEYFTRLRDATRHPEFMVRDIAVSAIAYPAWPEFRAVLREVAAGDPVERVRDNAARILESFDRQGVATDA